jgi:thiol-disulfide isomerase/thioredoxin
MGEDQIPAQSDPAPAPLVPRGRRWLLPTSLLVIVAIAGAIYGIRVLPGNGGFGDATSPCGGTGEIVARVKPAIHGEVAALVPATAPLTLSQLSFRRDDGTPATLADWAGKTVLLNLWATWCAPCRAEMPALDRLQAALGSKDFQVLTINVDTANAGNKPKTFLNEIGVKSLAFQSDPTLGVFKALEKVSRSRGLPTTMLIDGKGCEIGTMYGPASWDSADGQKLIAAALGRS